MAKRTITDIDINNLAGEKEKAINNNGVNDSKTKIKEKTNNINNNNNTEIDIIDEMLLKKDDEKVFIGAYVDKGIATTLNKVSKKAGKGFKSTFVQEAIKRLLIEKGLM